MFRKISLLVLWMTASVHFRSAAVISDNSEPKIYPAELIEYLSAYGYLSPADINRSDGITVALKKFQRLMGISADGHPDKVTKKLIRSPRCGGLDTISRNNHETVLRKVMGKKELTYTIRKWSPWMPRRTQNRTILTMLRLWADDIAIKCTWRGKRSDVNIIFESDEGKSGKARHSSIFTEVKETDGVYEVHFYSKATRSISALKRASAHAFGHVFGHQHTNLYSIMSPIFRTAVSAHSSVVPPVINKLNGRCEVSITSAFGYLPTGITYFMRGSAVWSLREGYLMESGPQYVSSVFKDIPVEFDEGFVWGYNWQTYIFKGNLYYRLNPTAKQIDTNYPYPISEGWPGVPDDIDAAFTTEEGLTYFFKGDKAYLFDNDNNQIHPDYPQQIGDVFRGLPNNIDTVFRYYYDGKVYFFKGLYYWIWNGSLMRAEGPYVIKYGWKNLCFDE